MPANEDRYAVSSAWRNEETELKLPSGQLCLVRRIPLQELVKRGIIDDFDSLTEIVQTKHVDPKSKVKAPRDRMPKRNPKDDVANIIADPEKLAQVMEVTDKVVMAIVLKPEIKLPPGEGEERDPNAAYIDWVAEEDKGFLMQFAFGGVRDLERFRAEIDKFGDGLDSVEDLAKKTK